MKHWRILFYLIIGSGLSLSIQTSPAQDVFQTGLVNIQAVDAPTFILTDSGIKIGAEVRRGEGIIIDKNGIIATNRHIVGHAQHIYVIFTNGKMMEGKIARRGKTDVCLLKISPLAPLQSVKIGDAAQVKGQNIIAMTKAGERIHRGQVFKVFKDASSPDVLEMQLTTFAGDSGSAILNQNGSLIGMVIGQQISDPSKSYAVASNTIAQEYANWRQGLQN